MYATILPAAIDKIKWHINIISIDMTPVLENYNLIRTSA